MNERVILERLSIVARDEFTFLERGYGKENVPDYVQQELKELRASISWLNERLKLLDKKEALVNG